MVTPNDTPLKTCSKCGKEYPATAEYFGPDKSNKDGLLYSCRKCRAEYNREWRKTEKAKAYYHQYYLDHIEEKHEQSKQWREANTDRKREKDREYRERNRDRVLENKRRWHRDNQQKVVKNVACWRKANPGKHRRHNQRYYVRHQAKINAYHRQYREQNPEKEKAKSQRRRAREQNAAGVHTAADIRECYMEQAGRCAYCGMPVYDDYHVDHIIPLARGGTNWPENICIACPNCNLEKGDKTLAEWFSLRGW